MKGIVAVDKNWGIGKQNDLLFSIPEDMAFFRKTTLNKVVVMGSRTLKSFPNAKPLKNRTNVVLSKTIESADGFILARNEAELREQLKSFADQDIFVIGGASVYKQMLPYCTEMLVTKVDADGLADTFIPNLDKERLWKQTDCSEEIQSNGYKIRFCTYKNTKPLDF